MLMKEKQKETLWNWLVLKDLSHRAICFEESIRH